MGNASKKIVFLILSGFVSSVALASYPTVNEPFTEPQYHTGFYVGGQWGRGAQSLDNGSLFDTSTGNTLQLQANKTHGVVGRMNLGFSANRYFAIEIGGTYWPQAHYSESVTDPSGIILSSGRAKSTTHDLDFLAKVTLPFNNGWGVFTKLGASRLVSDTKLTSAASSLTPNVFLQDNGKDHALRPEAAAGVSYEFNPNWLVDLDYDYVRGRKNNSLNKNYLPNAHSVTFGIQYNFVSW